MKGIRIWSSLAVGLLVVGGLSAAPQKKRTSSKKKTKVTRKKKAPAPAPKPKVNPAYVPMAGTWFTLDKEGKFAKANKFVFTGAGDFSYFGPGWTSSGTFKLADHTLILTWVKVDGVKQAKPFSRTVTLGDDKKSFPIDRFTYGKS